MRDHHYFDRFARDHKMRPVVNSDPDEKQGRILLADSGEIVVEDGRMFYRTGYAIIRDGEGLDVGCYADYEIGEPGGSASEQDYRLTEAKIAARLTMDQLDETGYYDANRKHDFSQRPQN